MSNRKLNLGSRLQGSEPFLEIQSVNTDNFLFDANSTLNLADSLSVENLTINGTFTNAGGGNIGGSTATYTTSITTPKIIFTDNNATGLTIESSDGADFITCDSTNGSEHIDILKDMNTGGNKVTHGTNGSRGIIQYGDIRNSTIDNTNTLSANTSGTSASWASSRTISFRNSANGDAAMGSVAINGTGDVNADIDILDQTNSSAHKFIIANTNTGHTSTNLQQRIDFLNAQDSNITRSDNLQAKISVVNDNMSFIVYDKSHASNSSTFQLTKDIADDIPKINSFLHFSTQANGERFMNIENNNLTHDDDTAKRQYPTSIHLGNAGNFQDSVVGNTISKLKANWRADGEGQVELLARRSVSSAAHECGFLITADSGGGTALDVPIVGTQMVMKGQKLGGIHDVDYFNGMKVGHAAMVGNGLQILTSGGGVVSGAPSAYGNAIHPKLKSGGGLAVDGDGLYATNSPEFAAGSGIEIIASPHKVIGLVANSLTGSKLTAFSGTDTTLLSANNHIFGRMVSDNSDPVHGGLTIVGYNEGTGGDVGGHSQLVLQNAHTESTDGLCDEIGVLRLQNEGDLTIQMGKKQETNTDQIYNGANGVVYDKMKFYREGGALLQLGAFNGTDAVLANHETNIARSSAGDNTFTLYNDTDDMMLEMIVGRNNLLSGTDLASNALSQPSGFQIIHQQGGDTILNNNKTKAIIFKVGNAEKVRVDDNGYLGVANSSPEVPIEVGTGVNVAGNALPSNYHQSFYVSAHGHGGLALGAIGDLDASTLVSDVNTSQLYISIYAYGNVISYFGFMWGSDERMKCEIEELDDTEALDMIKAIETKKYHYKDLDKRNPMKTIGFIAQDVKNVFPNAIQEKSAYVPDENRAILNPLWEEVNNKWKLTIDDIDWQDNHTGKCQFIMLDNGREDKYIRVEDDKKSFLFDEKFEKIWFFGKQITDFHHLDKAQIFALHHSGIQQLCKINDAQAIKNTELENKNTELENKVNLLETENNSLLTRTQVLEDKNVEYEQRISSLETLLQELTAKVSFNESALKGLIN